MYIAFLLRTVLETAFTNCANCFQNVDYNYVFLTVLNVVRWNTVSVKRSKSFLCRAGGRQTLGRCRRARARAATTVPDSGAEWPSDSAGEITEPTPLLLVSFLKALPDGPVAFTSFQIRRIWHSDNTVIPCNSKFLVPALCSNGCALGSY